MHGSSISSTLVSTNNNTSSTALSLTSSASPGQLASSLKNNNNTSSSSNSSSCSNSNNNNNNNNTNTNNVNSSCNMVVHFSQLQHFEVIRKWLLKHHKKYCEQDQPSTKSLSQFILQLIQFQEENLGRDAAKSQPGITRLPYEVLVDVGQGGALCHLFAFVLKYKHEQKM